MSRTCQSQRFQREQFVALRPEGGESLLPAVHANVSNADIVAAMLDVVIFPYVGAVLNVEAGISWPKTLPFKLSFVNQVCMCVSAACFGAQMDESPDRPKQAYIDGKLLQVTRANGEEHVDGMETILGRECQG